MDAPRQMPLPMDYDGAERRRSREEYAGAERRQGDPKTEQDHPELYELPVEEPQ